MTTNRQWMQRPVELWAAKPVHKSTGLNPPRLTQNTGNSRFRGNEQGVG